MLKNISQYFPIKETLQKAGQAVKEKANAVRKQIIRTVFAVFFLLLGILLVGGGLFQIAKNFVPGEYLLLGLGILCLLLAWRFQRP